APAPFPSMLRRWARTARALQRSSSRSDGAAFMTIRAAVGSGPPLTISIGHIDCSGRYSRRVTKHLVDLDEAVLDDARAEFGTNTIKDTVNEALRRATEGRLHCVTRALDRLAEADLDDRASAWR